MTWTLLVIGIGIVAAAMGARRLSRRASQAPDQAWRATGIRYTTGRNYLQAQAIANAQEARKRSASGRLYGQHLEQATQNVAVPAARRGAQIVQLRRRRA